MGLLCFFLVGVGFCLLLYAFRIPSEAMLSYFGVAALATAAALKRRHIDVFLSGYFLFLPFIAVAIPVGNEFGITIASSLWLVLILAWARRVANGSIVLFRNSVDLSLGVFIVACGVSIAISYFVGELPVERLRGEYAWFKSGKQFVAVLLVGLGYLSLAAFLDSRARIEKCIRVYLTTAVAVALFGGYQFVSRYFELGLPLESLPRFNPSVGDFGEAGGLGVRGNFPRVSAVLVEPSYLGIFLVTAAPLLFAAILCDVVLTGRGRARQAISFAIIVAIIAMTFSRGPYFALVITMAATGALVKGGRWMNGVILSLLLIAVTWYVDHSLNIGFIDAMVETSSSALDVSGDISVLERLTSMTTEWRIFRDNPIFGVGLGQYSFYFEGFKPDWGFSLAEYGEGEFVSLNLWTRLLAETGLFGFISYGLMCLLALKAGVGACTLAVTQRERAIAIGLSCGLLGFLVALLTIGSFYHLPFQWVLMALCVGFKKLMDHEALMRVVNDGHSAKSVSVREHRELSSV